MSWLLTGRMVLRAFWDALSRLQFSNSAWIKFSNSFLERLINFWWRATKAQRACASTDVQINTRQRFKASVKRTSGACSGRSSWLWFPLFCKFQPLGVSTHRLCRGPSSCSKAISRVLFSQGTQNCAACWPRSESSSCIVLPSFLVFESRRHTYSQTIHQVIKVKIPSESLVFSENHGISLPCSCFDKLPQCVVSNDGKPSSHSSGSQGVSRATFPRGLRRKSFIFPPSFKGVPTLLGLVRASHGESLESQIPV